MDRPYTQKAVLLYAGLFILSAAGLAFEVSLTRIYSFLFVQSYVYILISCSVAGIGFGAVTMYYVREEHRSRFLRFTFIIPVLVLIILLSINSLHALLIPSLLLTFLVYAGIGILQVQIFQKSGMKVSSLYAADLTGASLGSILSFLALNSIGALNTLYLIVFLMSAAFILVHFYFFPNRRFAAAALAASAVLLIGANSAGLGRNMFPNSTWQKEMTVMLDDKARNPEITETIWSAFGRVDLVETDNPYFMTMFIDGAAGTKMVNMQNGKVDDAVARSLLLQYMGGIPLLVVEEEKKERAAIIGSGGGIDIVTLLLADYRQIDAVEINPDFIDLVRSRGAYNGGIYDNYPGVDLYHDEGRSFLRSSGNSYNLIMMSLPIIKSVRSLSNHSLTENYLFTWNAFIEYMNALEAGGYLLIIAHYPNELKRLFTNAVKAMEVEYGISPSLAAQHLVAIGNDQNPTLIVKKGVFSPTEVSGFNAILSNLPVTGSTNFVPFSGDGIGNITYNPSMVALSRGNLSLEQFIADNNEDISWVSDDSPFFYQMSKGLPGELKTVGLIVLLLITASLIFFTARRRKPEKSENRSESFLLLLSFGCIGLGYMLIEIGILQKFIVFWHHQTLALATVLAVILIASGTGSFLADRIRNRRAFLLVGLFLILIQAAAAFFLDNILLQFETSPLAVKLFFTIILTFPVFILMGIPFPFLLRQSVVPTGDNRLYPWMIGFNSIATLSGGVLSMLIAMTLGYHFIMIAGILSYVLLMGLVSRFRLTQ